MNPQTKVTNISLLEAIDFKRFHPASNRNKKKKERKKGKSITILRQIFSFGKDNEKNRMDGLSTHKKGVDREQIGEERKERRRERRTYDRNDSMTSA